MTSEVYEVSRIDSLSIDHRTIVGKAAAQYGVSVDDLIEHISETIEDMPVADAVKAANWYFDAHTFAQYLADTYDTTVEIAAAVIAAVSPRMPWLRNKIVAQSVFMMAGTYAELSAMDAAKAMKLGLSANVAMAVKIARSANIDETLTGIKRRSFYNNIVAPKVSDSVTVDTWMLMAYVKVTGTDKDTALKFIAANEKALNGTGAGYFMIADAVRFVASEMDMLPHQIQALYWVCASGNYNGGRTDIG